ncbi:MAG TPA: tRNA (adenosine(37)-N6)-threonylcarbamoyltransferase complex dimerization subunit type 1 TsaB [Bacteroidota bacterium]|nr:tRNA (adenosine(37)-N6)-threonylcarbamoyltransferase complex dimerization subunit type 1 TsaB [Bacteroidota bacterium]
MKILGLETSTEICSVGLLDDEGNEWSESIVEAHVHSEKILTITRQVFERSGTAFAELSAVAVSSGPGSFTGLRIGMSTAKGLCFALEIPLLVVPTFDGVAKMVFEKHSEIHDVVILTDAKQGDYYFQRFTRRDTKPIAFAEPTMVRKENATKKVSMNATTLYVVDRDETHQQITAEGGKSAPLADFLSGITVAHLGLKKYLAKEFADVASAEPMYLKDFVVKTPIR